MVVLFDLGDNGLLVLGALFSRMIDRCRRFLAGELTNGHF